MQSKMLDQSALSPQDLYRLRRASLNAQRALLSAQAAQQAVKDITLQLERKYGLLGKNASIDAHTGEIDLGDSHRKAP